METMQDFLQSAEKTIGISKDATERATGGLLNLIKDQAGQSSFDELLSKLPGAESLTSGASKSGAASLLGGASKMLGGALGGKLGGAASVMSMFNKSGLDVGQAGKLVSLFFSFAKGKAGSGLVEQILGKIPEIKKMIG